jgi:sugar phosphate isomerase/epimerase
MTQQKPSVQLYTVRDAVAENLQSAIDRVAAVGFTQVEPYGFVDRVDEFKDALLRNNLKAPTAHAMMVDQDWLPMLAAAQKLGVETLIDPFTVPERWTNKEDVLVIAKAINAIAEAAPDFGLQIAYHNHNWEFANHIGGAPALYTFIDALNDDVVLEIDTFWVEVGGQSAPEVLRTLGERVVAIHVKDGNKNGDVNLQVPAGQGQIPVREVLAAAPNALPVIEFDVYSGGDVFDGIKQSLAFVNEAR